MDSYKNNVLTWRMFMTSSMEAAIHLGQDFLENSESYKNTKFENIENMFNITQKFTKEHSDEDLGLSFTLVGEINTVQRQRDQVSEGKSLCLRRFSSMCWSDRSSTRSRCKMDRTKTVSFVPRRSGSWRRTNWMRVEFFQELQRWLFSRRTPRKSRIFSKRLDFSGSRFGKQMVRWLTWWTMVPYSQQIGAAIQRNWSSCFSQPPVLWVAECWSEEMAKMYHSLQWRLHEHRTMILNT